MASRHDIVSITFQANAGRANVALQALQTEARKSSDRVKDLKKQLEEGLRANLPADQIKKIQVNIKSAEREVKQWNNAYKELTKGVRTLDEAVKHFNSGTMSQMSAAFNKAAANAAKLAQTKMTPGTLEWKEMDALIVEAQSNVLKANADINGLVSTIKKGGEVSKSTLTQAKSDLEQLLTLETRSSAEWNNYNKQLKVVSGELNKLAEAERKAAQADQTSAMSKRMKDLGTMSSQMLAETKRFWETMVAGAKKGSAELTMYESKLKEVKAEEMFRMQNNAQQVLAAPDRFSVEQIRQAVQQIMQLRDTYRDTIPIWNKYNDLIKKGEAYLQEYAEREKIARGEAMSLADALRLSSTAGGRGFSGTSVQLQQAEAALQKASTTARKGSPEWVKYQEALARVRVEMQSAGMTSERMQAILAKPASAKNLNELQAAVKRAKAELDLMAGTVGKNNKAYTELAKRTKEAELQMKQLQSQSHGTASSFDKAWSRLKTYIGLYMGAAVAIQKLSATMGDLMDLSDKMGEVRKTTAFTADEVGRLSNELKKMDTRTALTGLMDLSVAAGQLGLKTEEDVLGFTEAANKLMVALPEMGKEGATEMLKVALATGEIEKIRRQMEQGLIDGSSATAVAMEKVGSTIDRLRATSAATAPAITDFVKRVGAVGAQSGISIDQVAALGSTVDALGMRVEMSATALSRMMPAIRNNAFDIAKILGITPNTIRELYDTGQGMEVILMILQRMKDSNMDADSIEQMLGMGGMKEIMKELNQQGARAGIVFGGLSQNVDELRRQLGVARQAYEENIAIQQEYDKMNETTAAKWERLKNEIEEAFVGDTAQRLLGGLIDVLRGLVNLLTGNVGPALGWITVLLKTFIAYWAALKIGLGEALFVKSAEGLAAMGGGLKNLISNTQNYIRYKILLIKAHDEETKAALRARMANEGLNKAMIANIWMAVAAAVVALGVALYRYIDSMREAGREAAKFQAELDKEQRKVNDLTNSIGAARVKIEDANKEVAKARAELDAAKKANDGTTESVNRLAKAESELLVKEEAKKNAMAAEKQLITEFNNQYSKYLGFMLSEVSSNLELARARDLVNSKLRETLTLKRQEAAIERVEKDMGGDRDKAYGKLYDSIAGENGLVVVNGRKMSPDPTQRPRIMAALAKAANSAKDRNAFIAQTKKIFKDNKYPLIEDILNRAVSYYDQVKNVRDATDRVIEQNKGENAANRQISQGDLILETNASFSNYNRLLRKYRGSKGDNRARNAAAVLQQMDMLEDIRTNASTYYDMTNPKEAALYRKQFGTVNAWKGYDRNTLLKEAGRYYTPRKKMQPGGGSGSGGSFTTSNQYTSGYSGDGIWGQSLGADSTDWKNMTAEQLVARRDQMNKFVNAIQTDTDIKAVLEEDTALKKAIENGMSSDMRTVIEWYNTERLKIQDELHARHLTNTGAWMDPKKQKAARKQFRDEVSTYLHELDAYYTERKTRIEEAGTDEGLTEAEIKNRTLANEMEWHQRRAELQKLYARKSSEVTQEEQDAIYHIISERTGDSEKFVKQMIGKTNQFVNTIEKSGEKGAAMVHDWLSKLSLDVERDYLKQQQALTKQMRAIEAIIDKERPFNGITRNLRENLVTMDILTGDMREEYNDLMKKEADMTKFNERQAAEELKRTTFMLGEAENAYSTTIEKLMEKMRQQGFTSWADWLQVQPKQQEAIMAQLRSTYDDIQDAIKKEASQLKKQAEIMWNNILLPGGDGKTTLKQMLDRTVAQLGIDEGRVSRANSLIGAGQASERVADRLAIKQMQLQLDMQEHYYALMKKQGQAHVDMLNQHADAAERRGDAEEATRKRLDAQHAAMSLNLATSKEETELAKQREEIIARTEESQNRLYKSLREWADLLGSSLQSLFEASHAGDPEYYNERAKLNLTGKGGPGAGTYVITDRAGTSGAKAHYEYLDDRAALERQREIERQNALADAWRKVMDDINMKMNDMITDQINAMLQNESIDANTRAVLANTEALYKTAGMQNDGLKVSMPEIDPANAGSLQPYYEQAAGYAEASAERQVAAIDKVGTAMKDHFHKQVSTSKKANEETQASTQSMYAKMTQAANLYGIAYQAMSNDNLSATQKFEMMAVQAAGQAAITMLTADLAAGEAKNAVQLPGILGKLLGEMPYPVAMATFAIITGLLGGLMGVAVSKITKSKSQIAQATGSSVGTGRLTTGMLQYAEGNVNEFTDPSTLTPGRQYNVDAADGRTYRARYMGRNPKTHITSGPEFHLVGERGREAIIDAQTTRQLQMDDNGIWKAIQTLYNGGSIGSRRRRTVRRGVHAFAEGNMDQFVDMDDMVSADNGGATDQMLSLQASIDRQSDLLEDLRKYGIKAHFDVYGKGGLIDSYDTGKKIVSSHGEKH